VPITKYYFYGQGRIYSQHLSAGYKNPVFLKTAEDFFNSVSPTTGID